MKTARVSIPSLFWERLNNSLFLDKQQPVARGALRAAFRAAEPYRAGNHLSLRVELTLEQVRLLETYAGDVVKYFGTMNRRSDSGVYRNAQTVLARMDAAAEGLSRAP